MSNLPNNLREYARVLEMCNGTEVNPLDCFRQRISVGTTAQATRMDQVMGLLAEPYPIEFALAIVEGRPVFAGDILYDKDGGRLRVVLPACTTKCQLHLEILDKNPSDPDFWVTDTHYEGEQVLFWNPPKRTFLLNGVELPLPDAFSHGGYHLSLRWGSEKDRDMVQQALIDMMGDKK